MKCVLLIAFSISIFVSLPAFGEEKLKVGMILSLSGKFAEYGYAQKNAVELAKKEDPKKFKNIEFIYEDCQYLGKNAASSFLKLKDHDRVDLFFVWGVEPSLVVSALARQHDVPLLLSGQLSRDEIEAENILRTINYAEQYSATLVKYMRQKGYGKIGVIKSELSFYNDRLKGMQEALQEGEKIDVLYELQPEEDDFRTIVASLKNRNIEALGLFLTPKQLITFYKTLSQQKVALQTFGSTPFESRRLVNLSGGEMIGAFYDHNDTSSEFHKRYSSEYGNDDQIAWAANAYDVALLLADIVDQHDGVSGDEILQLMMKTKGRSGAGGEYDVVYEDGVGNYFKYPLVVKEIREGSFEVVYP